MRCSDLNAGVVRTSCSDWSVKQTIAYVCVFVCVCVSACVGAALLLPCFSPGMFAVVREILRQEMLSPVQEGTV